MLEIILLVFLCRKVGEILRAKGRRAGWFQFLTVVAWFAGEFMGAVVGIMLAGLRGGLMYVGALVGAAAGVTAVYILVKSLAPADGAGPPGFMVSPVPTRREPSEL